MKPIGQMWFYYNIWADHGLFLYFAHSNNIDSFYFKIKIEKTKMECLGFETGAAGFVGAAKSQSYAGHPQMGLLQ